MNRAARTSDQALLQLSLAGLVAGFVFAIGSSGVIAFGLGLLGAGATRAQFTMWVVLPLWLTVWACVYRARSVGSAWRSLIVANAAVWGLWFAMTQLG